MYVNNLLSLSLLTLLMPYYTSTKHNFIGVSVPDNSCTAESFNSHVVCCFSQVTMKEMGVAREQKKEKIPAKTRDWLKSVYWQTSYLS